MTKSDISEILQEIINNILQSEINLSETDVNLFDLGLDSMSIVDFLIAIEEEFDIEIQEDELKEDIFTSAHTIVNLIVRRLSKKD